MSLFDFFFPDQAQAVHLRTIAEASRGEALRIRSKQFSDEQQRRHAIRLNSKTDDRVIELENELAQSALVIESLITLLEEKNLISRSELKARVVEIDSSDGVPDGKITPAEQQPFTPKRDWPV